MMPSDRRANRRPAASLWLLAFAVACSSGTTTGPTGPGGSAGPASLAVSSGDGQTAQPGAAVPIQPAVIIKDSASKPVPGVTVTFAVDSGGGSLSLTSAVTGTDGIARAGIWTLGPAEGRNTLKAMSGTLSPVKFTATAAIAGGALPTATVGTGGGTITSTDPGPLKGFALDVPAGAFSAAVQLQVSYASSATLPLPVGMTVASPIVTLGSNAAGPAAVLFTLRIPATIPAGQFPIVAMVDPSTGFLDALPTLTYDSVSVTAMGSVLDESQLLETTRRPSGPGGAALRLPQQVAYAVMLRDSAQLHTVTFDTHFLPGTDDWEFLPQPTQLFTSPEAGEVVSERYYFIRQKSLASGALNARFEEAPGVTVSDVSGIQWSAALAQQFDGLIGPHILAAAGARALNQLRYDRNTIQMIATSMIATGEPQIVAFVDPANGQYSTVLAYRWDGPSGTLYTANPDHPGDLTRHAIWDNNGLGCTLLCLAVAGVNHLIGYQAQLDAEYPSVLDGSIDRSHFPAAFATSYDSIIGETPEIGVDTLFMVHDTSRMWIECPTCAGSYPTSIALRNGASGIETQQIYLPSGTNAWSPSGGQTQTGFALDVTQLPLASGNHFADFQFGMEVLGLLTPAVGQSATTGWLGWKELHVIKFAPTINAMQVVGGAPVTFTLGTNGGPALPHDLTYLFKWGDGTDSTSATSLPASVDHAFARSGSDTVVMEMHHPSKRQLVGTASVVLTVPPLAWVFTSATVTSSVVPTLFDKSDTVRSQKVNAILANLEANPGNTVLFKVDSLDCSSLGLEQFAAGPAVTDVFVKSALVNVLGIHCTGADSTFELGTLNVGPVGSGPLTGSATQVGGGLVVLLANNVTPLGSGLGSINAVMNGSTLAGSFIWSVDYGAGRWQYTVQFQAQQVSLPVTLPSGSVRRKP